MSESAWLPAPPGSAPHPRFVLGAAVDLDAPLEVLVPAAAKAIAELPAEAAQDAEAKARALLELFRAEKREEADARRLAALALTFARRIGAELGPARRGRPSPGEDLPLPDLGRKDRATYRACAEPSEAEFLAWLSEAESVSRHALAKLGEKLRRERDSDTGEPKARASSESKAGGLELFPGRALSGTTEEPQEPTEVEAAALPATHRAAGWVRLIDDLLEELRDPAVPAEVQRAAEEAARALTRARNLLAALEPHACGVLGGSDPLSTSGNRPQGREQVEGAVLEPEPAAPSAEPDPRHGSG